ncbi:hypothetical protein IV203_006124 [Nitzschia inconspicua]|uniref:Uncharacterized protein n=1 Tax=Nitzschia inconspicua TaxID=303405 RepID=A0A9K3KQ39_9STRA|nr:hypothetical protein IV203_006124 [Nitzschia inconspicua]
MADIPKNAPRRPMTNNPITTDPALTRLLADAKALKTEEEFKGWKTSFLDTYRSYLDPAGEQNAKMSYARLVWSMEKLAGTVVAVKDLVNDGKISAESQTVMGKRAMTNMTDQLAKSELEISRFMPATGADEEELGYNKFELGAVMIEDGFHVYELLRSAKDIITNLQDKVLNDILPPHQKSIIQFYLRQVLSFNDVMADLGLFGLMEDILEMYKAIPRNKKGPLPKDAPKSRAPRKEVEPVVDEGPEIVELDPDKKYNFRAEFADGYIDPFSGTAPGPEENKDKNEEQKGSGGEDDFIIYFDMKTGTIGKIPRSECASKSLIVSQSDDGAEELQGEIEDDDEREKLIWDMKKAMKNKKGGGSAKSPGPNRKKYVITPRKDATGRTIGRTKSNENTLKKIQAPSLDKENGDPPTPPDKAGQIQNRLMTAGPTLLRWRRGVAASDLCVKIELIDVHPLF